MTIQIHISGDKEVLSVSGKYPEDESEAYKILAEMPTTRLGSTWGLDGVAVYCAEKHGCFTINKSGIDKRVAKKWLQIGKAVLTE